MDIKKVALILEISALISGLLFSNFKLSEVKNRNTCNIKADNNDIDNDQNKEIDISKDITNHKPNKLEINPTSRNGYRNVSSISSSFKSYMDYRTITDKTSQQYKLQHNRIIYTDKEGFRKSGDSFLVAIGTYYSNTIGEELEITLDTGETFNAILADIKDNKDTDSNNQCHKIDGSVVEFIVDSRRLLPIIKRMGDCSYSKENNFKGNVVSIVKIKKEREDAYGEMGNN